jgi:hypothetical protein
MASDQDMYSTVPADFLQLRPIIDHPGSRSRAGSNCADSLFNPFWSQNAAHIKAQQKPADDSPLRDMSATMRKSSSKISIPRGKVLNSSWATVVNSV